MTAEHLGGYWPGGDPAAYYPHLWEWLVSELEVGSVLDVGCGEGHALRYFRELGCATVGVDGIAPADSSALVWDYTGGPFESLEAQEFDLCWCCEFVEHVEERYVRNFVPSFQTSEWLALTHALPGQGGHHHVHEREPGYWLDLLLSAHFVLEPELTWAARLYASANAHERNYFARTGLIFRNVA